MKNIFSKISATLVISSLLLLPGCDWFKSKLGLDKSAAANDGRPRACNYEWQATFDQK